MHFYYYATFNIDIYTKRAVVGVHKSKYPAIMLMPDLQRGLSRAVQNVDKQETTERYYIKLSEYVQLKCTSNIYIKKQNKTVNWKKNPPNPCKT